MPRDHGRILCGIWRDNDFRARSVGAQRLYMLLLSQPNVNNAGLLPLQISKWAKGCDGTDVASVQLALDELVEHRFVFYDDDTEECLVRSYMRNDGVMAHKYIWKNALKCCESVESPVLREVLVEELLRTRRADAAETAAVLSGSERGPDPDGLPSEPDSDPIETALESHSDGTSHSNGISITEGRGQGKGRGEPSVVGSVGEEPSPNCSAHPNGTDRNCFACGQARKSYPERKAQWENARKDALAKSRERAIKACGDCDEEGWRYDDREIKCRHQEAM